MRILSHLTSSELEADDSVEAAPQWGSYGPPQPEDVLQAVDRLLEAHGLEIVQFECGSRGQNERLFLKVEKRVHRAA